MPAREQGRADGWAHGQSGPLDQASREPGNDGRGVAQFGNVEVIDGRTESDRADAFLMKGGS